MGTIKPWQLGLFILAIAALCTSLYYSFGRSDVSLASSLRMVDVNTGEFFSLKIGKGEGTATVPGLNPKTKQFTLMPVLNDHGKLVIAPRYFSSLKDIPGAHSAVDESTHEVKAK